jgi:hypothetical protein
MMKKLLLILLCLPMVGFGQNVNIPDANFKAYLVGNSLINTNGDNEIQVIEATSFSGGIDCGNMNISDLTGIEEFTNLTVLYCFQNQLTTLDVSNNTALIELSCGDNQLTTIDVSNNTSLSFFNCSNNQITTIDVSQNTALTEFFCHINELTSIDISLNINLASLICSYNLLTSLDASNNPALTDLHCGNNQLVSLNVQNGNNINWLWYFNYSFICINNSSLTCINVDDDVWSTANLTVASGNIDPQHYFSTNCALPSEIQEHTTSKELLKVTDLLGRETKETNQPLFYIYDDGTVEKRIVIE